MTNWPHSKQIASEIVRGWMLQDATERKMDALVRAIEIEIDKAFVYGRRAGEATTLEEAAKVAEDRPDSLHKAEAREIAAAIRALKEQP